MRSTDQSHQAVFEWREWLAFFGYVAATAVVVSVLLASIVLVVSTQADDSRESASIVPAGSETGRAVPGRS
jgi:negative regulator of sigma E activity